MELSNRQLNALRNAAIRQPTEFNAALEAALVVAGVRPAEAHKIAQSIRDKVALNDLGSARLRTVLLGTLLAPAARPNGLHGVRACRPNVRPRDIANQTIVRMALIH